MKTLVIGICIGAALLTACGEEPQPSAPAESTDAGASQADRAAVEAALQDYFGATTPQDTCASITLGMQTFIEGETDVPGDPSSPSNEGCVDVIQGAVEEGHYGLEAVDFEIMKVVVEGERAAASVVVNPAMGEAPYPLFLIEAEPARWLVTAENFTPPGFEGLEEEVGVSPTESGHGGGSSHAA